MKTPQTIEEKWQARAAKLLVGKKIVDVFYMDTETKDKMDWCRAPLVIVLDDGTAIYPSQDDEGNGPGSIFTTDKKLPTIPVI